MTMPTIELTLIAGRALFLVFSFVVAAITFTRWRDATRAQTEQVLAHHAIVLQRLAELEARVDATKASILRVGERVDRPQQRTSPVAAPAPGYQIAIRLAKGGASRDELISGCGLSIHEAELLQRLHSSHSSASAVKPAAIRGIAELRQSSVTRIQAPGPRADSGRAPGPLAHSSP